MGAVKVLSKSPTLAYYDSLADGLVPCKIVEHSTDDFGIQHLTVEITANRKLYKRGDRFGTSPIFVVPRSHVVRHKNSFPTILPYRWEFE